MMAVSSAMSVVSVVSALIEAYALTLVNGRGRCLVRLCGRNIITWAAYVYAVSAALGRSVAIAVIFMVILVPMMLEIRLFAAFFIFVTGFAAVVLFRRFHV